jgi:hypothetical protein
MHFETIDGLSMGKHDIDLDRIEEAVLALMYLTVHDVTE